MTREYADICLRALMRALTNGNDLMLFEWTLDPQRIWLAGVLLDRDEEYWRLSLVLTDEHHSRTGRFERKLGPVNGPDPPADAQTIQFMLDGILEDATQIRWETIFGA